MAAAAEALTIRPTHRGGIVTEDKHWPKSVEEAADRVISIMPEKDKRFVRETKREKLVQFHFGLGLYIRNAFGLWQGNSDLLESCGCRHPDDCSMEIVTRIWEKLQGEGR